MDDISTQNPTNLVSSQANLDGVQIPAPVVDSTGPAQPVAVNTDQSNPVVPDQTDPSLAQPKGNPNLDDIRNKINGQANDNQDSVPNDSPVTDGKKEIFKDESEYKDLINNDILDLIGLKDLPQEEKKDLYKKVLETVEDRSMVRVVNSLSPEKQEELNNLLDSQESESINDFFTNNGIDLEKIMFEESMLYKAELVGLTKESASNEA